MAEELNLVELLIQTPGLSLKPYVKAVGNESVKRKGALTQELNPVKLLITDSAHYFSKTFSGTESKLSIHLLYLKKSLKQKGVLDQEMNHVELLITHYEAFSKT